MVLRITSFISHSFLLTIVNYNALMEICTLRLNQRLTPLWMPFYTVANALTRESLMSRHHDLLMMHLALYLHAKLCRCRHQTSLEQ